MKNSEDALSERVSRLEQDVIRTEQHFNEAFWRTLDVAYDAVLPLRELRCIVCDCTGRRDKFGSVVDRCQFGGGKLERYRCPMCDCVFGPQKYLDLDDAFVTRDYQILYSRYAESDSTANEIRTFHSLAPVPGGLYLDWGCGAWSRTVQELRAQHWDVWGYEPSVDIAADFVVKNRAEISARFDGIFSNNVIEHFRDPITVFKELHSILKDGGVMAHSSPCYEYSYAFTRFHTLFLLGRSPHVLAERTGFKVIRQTQDGEYINYVFARI
jgi:SAM-dependent methyltransferase